MIDCVNPAAQQGLSRAELQGLLEEIRRYGQLTPKLLGLCLLYVLVYPWIGKVLSPRRRAIMLYQARSLVRRTG